MVIRVVTIAGDAIVYEAAGLIIGDGCTADALISVLAIGTVGGRDASAGEDESEGEAGDAHASALCGSRTRHALARFRSVTDEALGWPLPTWGTIAPSRNGKMG